MVHRDLTPRNVVLGPDGPRVVDFGIAWFDGAAAVTEAGMRVGTPSWMAPERLTHDEVTPAGDVWSWGAVMAFAALGHPVVGGSSPEVAAHRMLRGEVDISGVPGLARPLGERGAVGRAGRASRRVTAGGGECGATPSPRRLRRASGRRRRRPRPPSDDVVGPRPSGRPPGGRRCRIRRRTAPTVPPGRPPPHPRVPR